MTADEDRHKLFAKLTETGGRVRVRSAMNPILCLSGVMGVPSLAILGWVNEPPVIITILLCAVVATALFSFLYLLIFDRDRLQSEEDLIRKQTLELIEQRGTRKAIDAAAVKAIPPDFHDLPPDPKGTL